MANSAFVNYFEVGVSASRLWEAFLDGDNLFPRVAPHFIASIEHVGGGKQRVGGVRHIKFGSMAIDGAFVKEKLLSIDPQAMSITYEEVEGGHLSLGFRKWTSTMKITAMSEDKVKVEFSTEYVLDGGADPQSAHAKSAMALSKQGLTRMFKGLERYLSSNPSAYCPKAPAPAAPQTDSTAEPTIVLPEGRSSKSLLARRLNQSGQAARACLPMLVIEAQEAPASYFVYDED